MSGATERAGARDRAGVSVDAGLGVVEGPRVRGYYDLKVYSPAIVRLSRAERDIHRTRIKRGRMVEVSMKRLEELMAQGRLREILEYPKLRWQDGAPNLVVNTGLNHYLDSTLSGATQITAWLIGLTDDSPTVAAGDTMASHVGWTEFTEYSEANRQSWVDGGVSGQSVDNSASTADFSCNNDTNGGLGGLFFTDNNTKGGSTGLLFSAAALSGGNKPIGNGDTARATYTQTMADDGV